MAARGGGREKEPTSPRATWVEMKDGADMPGISRASTLARELIFGHRVTATGTDLILLVD
jgi:hypothetical protein